MSEEPEQEGQQETGNSDFAVLENSAGYKLHCRRWKPANSTPIALVLIVHGFAEHLEYYDEIATEMAKKSVLVFGHDHCGFGKSEGPRAFIDNFNKYSTDCLQHVALLQEEFPGVPTFILGHSMGGTIALKLIMKNASLFGGAVLVAPAVTLNPALASRTKIFAVKLLARFIPHYVVGNLEYDKITRDPNIIERMKTDLYRWHSGMKAKFAVEFIGAMQEIYNNLSTIDSPFLLLHGANDQLVELSGSRCLFDAASSQDKTFKVFDNAYHNLFVELEDVKNESNNMIIDWIVSHALNRPGQTAVHENATLAEEIAHAVASEEHQKVESSPGLSVDVEIGTEEVESMENVQSSLAFVDDDVEPDHQEPKAEFVAAPKENVHDANVALGAVVIDEEKVRIDVIQDVDVPVAVEDDKAAREDEGPALGVSSEELADDRTSQNRSTSDTVIESREVEVAKNNEPVAHVTPIVEEAQNISAEKSGSESDSDSESKSLSDKEILTEKVTEVVEVRTEEKVVVDEGHRDSLGGRQSPEGQTDVRSHGTEHEEHIDESLPAVEQ